MSLLDAISAHYVAATGITRVQTKQAANNSPAWLQATVAGNIGLLAIGGTNNSSITPTLTTPPSGWTLVDNKTGSSASGRAGVWLYWKILGASEAAPTFASTTTGGWILEEWTATAHDVDFNPGVGSGGGTLTCTSNTTTGTGDLIFAAACAKGNAPSAWSAPLATDSSLVSGTMDLYLASGIQAAAGAYAPSVTVGGASAIVAGSFKP